ncbi:MAG TPA: HAMP domain-containing sensor histidine kinase [Planctomycetaceae bacterium]|nr:HAMP domain-containing sensor histidine kinase [Planctomycetaceae bacterium]
MSVRMLREVFGTLRFRLTLWNSAIVLLMVVSTLWGVREALRLTLWHDGDEQLQDDLREIGLNFLDMYPNVDRLYAELDHKTATHTHRGFFVRLFDEKGELVWASANAPDELATLPIGRSTGPISVGSYRIVQMRLERTDVPHWTIRAGASYALLDDEVAQITKLMLVVGAIVLIVTPIGGYWLAGRATHPLSQIMDTTERLHPTNLQERLPLRGTRDELDRLSQTINNFLDRIALYVNRNREFTANAAHELRSPLAAIQSSLEVTLNSDRSVDEYKETLAETLDQCEELRVLVNQLLLLAESDAGELKIGDEPIDLGQVVQRSVEMFQGVAESREVRLELNCPRPVFLEGNATRLRQVVNNLIDNALKFTESGGRIRVDLYVDTSGTQAVLKVADSGAGIPTEDLPHIFERFYLSDKARQRERPGRGSGLGLPICKAIVESHNGQISIESTPTRGTAVVITLPRRQPRDRTNRPQPLAALSAS